MAAAQIETFENLNLKQLNKLGNIFKEMLTPTILGDDYPLAFSGTAKTYQWADIAEDSKVM